MFAQISFSALLALPLLATAGLIPSGLIPSGILPTGLIPAGIIPAGIIPSGGGEGAACATGSAQCCGSTQSVSLSYRCSLIQKLTGSISPPT